MLGVSLESGEMFFWLVLTVQYGWAVFWAFVVGVFTQFLINAELQRWTLVTDESILHAFVRVESCWPWIFLVGGLISLGWPGWAVDAAQVATMALELDGAVALFGTSLATWKPVAVAPMGVVWLSYQVSSVVYNVAKVFRIGLLFVAIGAALLLAAVTGSWVEFADLPMATGSVGTLPEGLDIAAFLDGLTSAGAGGYLNPFQSL